MQFLDRPRAKYGGLEHTGTLLGDPGRLPHLGLSRPAQRSRTLQPAYSLSRQKRPVTSKTSTISLPPSPLRLLPAGTTVAGRDLHPLEMHAFARRQYFDQSGHFPPVGVLGHTPVPPDPALRRPSSITWPPRPHSRPGEADAHRGIPAERQAMPVPGAARYSRGHRTGLRLVRLRLGG